jgi:2-iminobutanoate/2-iminopropanoate deaminase
MRKFVLIAGMIISTTSFANDTSSIKRHELGTWERDIGYSGITEVNNQLYISGVACEGKNMEEAVKSCYTNIQDILKKFNLTSEQIIKETIYTIDIDALIKVIPTRKSFFKPGQYPAATWVQVSRLYSPEHLLEVELIVQKK